MTILTIDIGTASEHALAAVKAVVDKNERERVMPDEPAGPLRVAQALSDFFEMASAIENSEGEVDKKDMTGVADYALDLFDRVAFQLNELQITNQRGNISRLFAIMSVWFARRGAELANLQGAADGFAALTNGLEDPADLTEMCLLMEEVVEAAAPKIAADADRGNPWRPWRVLNLNVGVAATRAMDARLMDRVFGNLVQLLPHDAPGFFNDGRSQMDVQEVPEAVREVLRRYAAKYPSNPANGIL